jgi:lipopolysaccharide/colanic/teichoic acid biosynthesis glycosyltransferase
MSRKGLNFMVQQAFKRFFDILLSLAGLVILSPLLALIALAVRLDSPGPALFSHLRIGKGGRPFVLYKFRSMLPGGDDSAYLRYLHALIHSDLAGPARGLPYRKLDADPRLTRLGRLLRCSYLDELPQLFNVLRGEMSLVGPRPHVPFEVAHYTPEQRRRLAVCPGLTGLWQVDGKAECTFGELVRLDLDYIDRWSLWLDLHILFKTLVLLLRGGERYRARQAGRILP